MPTLTTQGNLPRQAEVYEYTGAYSYGEQDRGDYLSKTLSNLTVSTGHYTTETGGKC